MRGQQIFDLRVPDTETGRTFLSVDWSRSPLGPIRDWPHSLRTAVQICLNSQFPMTLAWGDHLANFYNDGYLPIVGDKHPQAFGQPVRLAYPEIWDFLEPRITGILAAGDVIWEKDLLLPLVRKSAPEECYFTFCYSPLHDDGGSVAGVLSVATDTTAHVLSRRRGDLMTGFNVRLSACRTLDEIEDALVQAVQSDEMDFDQVAIYRHLDNQVWECVWSRSDLPDPKDVKRPRTAPGGRGLAEVDGGYIASRQVRHQGAAPYSVGLWVKPHPLVPSDETYARFLQDVMDAVESSARRLIAEVAHIRHVERERDKSDRLYRLIFDHSQDGIIFSAPDGRILAANPAACALLGYTQAELRAVGRQGVVVPDDRLARGLDVRARTGAFAGELSFRASNDDEVPVDLTSAIFDDEETGEKRSIIVFRDARPRRDAEERLKASARTEAIGRLTAGIAHDFNNLLHVIIAGADDLVAGGRGPAFEGSIDLIQVASRRAVQLTRQLLSFSRREILDPRRIRIGSLVQEIDQILSRAVGEAVDVEIRMDDENACLFVDPAQLQSAIINLVLNARDAMPDGGKVSLAFGVDVLRVDDAKALDLAPAEYVRIDVSDNGVGIPPEHLQQVVEPYFTTKPAGHGTGLGLSMAHGFARQSGGALRIVSAVGGGTTATLFLPRDGSMPDAAEDGLRPTGAESTRPATASPGGDLRVLIVEDNELVAATLEMMLSSAGYETTVASTPSAALAHLNDAPAFSLMLSDIVLGAGGDGLMLALEARQARPDLPIVLMTGYQDPDGTPDQDIAFRILRKPVRRADLLDAIAREIGARGLRSRS